MKWRTVSNLWICWTFRVFFEALSWLIIKETMFFLAGNPYWFELDLSTLSCYSFDHRDKRLFKLKLSDFSLRYTEPQSGSSKHVITLSNPNDDHIKHLQLSFESVDAFKAWKEAFARVINRSDKVCFEFFSKAIKKLRECFCLFEFDITKLQISKKWLFQLVIIVSFEF